MKVKDISTVYNDTHDIDIVLNTTKRQVSVDYKRDLPLDETIRFSTHLMPADALNQLMDKLKPYFDQVLAGVEAQRQIREIIAQYEYDYLHGDVKVVDAEKWLLCAPDDPVKRYGISADTNETEAWHFARTIKWEIRGNDTSATVVQGADAWVRKKILELRLQEFQRALKEGNTERARRIAYSLVICGQVTSDDLARFAGHAPDEIKNLISGSSQ